jgi:hypothetical protein
MILPIIWSVCGIITFCSLWKTSLKVFEKIDLMSLSVITIISMTGPVGLLFSYVMMNQDLIIYKKKN